VRFIRFLVYLPLGNALNGLLFTRAWNLLQSKFLQPGTALQHWAVVVFAPPHQAPPEPRVHDFFRTLTTVAKGKGAYPCGGCA